MAYQGIRCTRTRDPMRDSAIENVKRRKDQDFFGLRRF